MISRQLVRPVAIVLTVVGAIIVALAVVYLSMKASQLPSFMPGHLAARVTKTGHVIRTHTHAKLGIALFLAGVGALGGAWWIAFRYEPAD